jgi:hypothetical protein
MMVTGKPGVSHMLAAAANRFAASLNHTPFAPENDPIRPF